MAIPPYMRHMLDICWIPNFHLSFLHHCKKLNAPKQATILGMLIWKLDIIYKYIVEKRKVGLPKICEMYLNPLQSPLILVSMEKIRS